MRYGFHLCGLRKILPIVGDELFSGVRIVILSVMTDSDGAAGMLYTPDVWG